MGIDSGQLTQSRDGSDGEETHKHIKRRELKVLTIAGRLFKTRSPPKRANERLNAESAFDRDCQNQ